jgi:hypothetical protein
VAALIVGQLRFNPAAGIGDQEDSVVFLYTFLASLSLMRILPSIEAIPGDSCLRVALFPQACSNPFLTFREVKSPRFSDARDSRF